ncbi:MAG: SBBP repeat-containing protein [Verrucomicrobiales bacterium]|nr:SBBP repeat-containing protein [Verrucomicrobiales bacterium]
MKAPVSNMLPLCVAALTVGILGDTLASAQPAVETWRKHYHGMAESDDRPRQIVVDSAGNVIVAGSSDAGTEEANGSDWIVVKYSNSGVPLWTNLFSGPYNSVDGANAVAEDSDGDVIVTGYSLSHEQNYFSYVTIKYSGAGMPLWTNRYDAPWPYSYVTPDYGNELAVGRGNEVFVTGGNATLAYSSEGVPLWTNGYPASEARSLALDSHGDVVVTGHAGNYSDYVTVKYSHAGIPLWTNRYILCGYGADYTVAVDRSDNAFVAGSTDCNGSAIVSYSSAGMARWTNLYNPHAFGDAAPSSAGVVVDGAGNVFVTGTTSGAGDSGFVTVAYSNEGLPFWTNRYHGPGTGKHIAAALDLDGEGNVFVTGSSLGRSGYYDFATIKYSGAGVSLWTNRYVGPGDSRAASIAVDSNGNAFVTGSSWGGSSYDGVTIAYSGAGVPLWTNRFDRLCETDDDARAMVVDNRGNVFVTGSSSGAGVSHYTTLAYSREGVPLWANRHIPPGNTLDAATAAAVDASGHVIVTGRSSRGHVRDPYASSDYATIKYSNAGVPLWIHRYNGPGNGFDEATAVAVDGRGNVFVTGRSASAGGASGYATIMYSEAGTPVWTNRYSARDGTQPSAMAVDRSGNVIVTGEAWSGSTSISSDYVTVKYSGEGVPAWTNRYNGRANASDAASAVAVDTQGNVFVTGYSSNGDPLTRSSDYTTIKYSSGGVPVWTNGYGGQGNNLASARALVVGGNGNVVVTGSSDGGFATVAYSNSGIPLWTNLYRGQPGRFAYATAIAVDGNGNIAVTGNSTGTDIWPDVDFATIKYSSGGVPLWTNLYDGPAHGTDIAAVVAIDASGDVVVAGKSWNGTSHDCVTIKYSSTGVPLTITRTGTSTIAVSWPSTASSVTLQQNTDGIISSNWSAVLATPQDNGTTRTVMVGPSSASAFFRLLHP